MTDLRMTRARAVLIRDHAFFGALAMHLDLVEDQSVERFQTDGKVLRYNPKFIDELTEPETQTVVAECVLHCALGHHTRIEWRDPAEWNEACDYVVWPMLQEAGFVIPYMAHGFIDDRFRSMNAEQVYKALQAEKPPEPEYQDGDDEQDQDGDDDGDQGGEGSGQGQGNDGDDEVDLADVFGHGPSAPGWKEPKKPTSSQPQPSAEVGSGQGFGDVTPPAPSHDQAALQENAEEWEVTTRQAISVAQRQAGTLPGFIQEIVTAINETKVDWRQVLRRFVEPSMTKDYSWSNPNRRMLALGYVVPGVISDGVGHLALLIDTSASVDSVALAKVGGELQALLDEGAVDKVTVIFIDTRVNRTVEYVKGETIDLTCHGRGGTAFAPGFEWINENVGDIAGAIYFTDMECWEFGPEPPYPVLWAKHGEANTPEPPFGEVMQLPT